MSKYPLGKQDRGASRGRKADTKICGADVKLGTNGEPALGERG